MKLGFFIMPVHPLTRPYAETLREDREAFILADRLGYSEGYCGEHLTDLAENIPSSLMFCASLAGYTRQIKLGTAVANLPFSHPLLVAAHAALVDNLLEGRFLLGIGAGILRTDCEALEMLDADRGAMFAEAIDHILALWSGDAPYDLKGKYWNISTAKTHVAGDRTGQRRQAVSETASADSRYRNRSGLQGFDRARPPRLVADLVAFPASQPPHQPVEQLRQRLRRRRPSRRPRQLARGALDLRCR